MPASAAADSYDFIALTHSHLPLVREWLAAPHVARWYGEGPDEALAHIRAHIDDRAIGCSPLHFPEAFGRALSSARLFCSDGPKASKVAEDPRLRALIEAWPQLNEAAKAKVVKQVSEGSRAKAKEERT